MTDFAFRPTVNTLGHQTALGPDANNKFADADVGKAVKLGTANNHVLAVGGDEIRGFVLSIAPFTVNSGFSFGAIQQDKMIEALVGANQGVTDMAVGDLVVADTQAALGTAEIARVKTGTPTTFKWQCVDIVTGTGAAGDKVLLERV